MFLLVAVLLLAVQPADVRQGSFFLVLGMANFALGAVNAARPPTPSATRAYRTGYLGVIAGVAIMGISFFVN